MSRFLEKINSPADLKKLSFSELDILASEVREYIIETISENGGHLAPSLGVVELTIALHYYLDLPNDDIVWDVGHQCYPHKILTGRRDEFSGIRTFGGISGYPKPLESDYDAYIAGHSSTSISIAAGIKKAAILQGQGKRVIPVIGDGALTGGMAYEALNQVGSSRIPMVIILNDNNMSISENVGAMSNHLARLRTNPSYRAKKADIKSKLQKVPAVGEKMARDIEWFKRNLKYSLSADGVLFEEMGFAYIGPVDGHDIESLVEILSLAHRIDKPVLIHAVTQKGRGYAPAEKSPNIFHGTGPFDIETGELKSKGSKSYTDYFGEKMMALGANNDKVCAITAAMPSGTGLTGFSKAYPDRFFDVGIAEGHAVAFGAAMASRGMKPVIALYSSFLQRGFDQVVHDVCIAKSPLVIAIDRGGLVGDDGETHHGIFDIAMMMALPNMNVFMPRDGASLQAMLDLAIDINEPVAIRYHRGGVQENLVENPAKLVYGKGEILANGSKIVIFAVGNMVKSALAVREILAKDGFDISVVDLRFAKPLDRELILEFAGTHKYVITMEEGILAGGIGYAINQVLLSGNSSVKVLNLGIDDMFVTHGSVAELLDLIGLTPEKMAVRILEFTKED